MNQTHPIQTSQSNFHNMDFCIIIILLKGSIDITMARIYAGSYGVQILAEVLPFTTVQLLYLFTESDRQSSTQ